MPYSKQGRRWAFLVVMLLLLMALLAACGDFKSDATTGNPAPTAPNSGNPSTAPDSTPKQEVTLALGYLPNVQFAHIYVALEKGYFAAEGLDVKIQYGTINDLMTVVGQGKIQFAQASGDEVLQARAQGIPVTTIASIYQKYPVALAARKESNITKPADLKGKSIAIPGPYGSNYLGLKVLLAAANLTEDDVKVQSVGFTQVQALQQGKVDSAVVFSMNEPLQLRKAGVNINTIEVSSLASLASIGLITSDNLIASNPALVQKMVRAVTRGLKDTLANPDDAFERTIKVAPDAKGADPALQKQVLETTAEFMIAGNVKGQPLGYSDPQVWEASVKFLLDQKLLPGKLDPANAYTNKFLSPEIGKYS